MDADGPTGRPARVAPGAGRPGLTPTAGDRRDRDRRDRDRTAGELAGPVDAPRATGHRWGLGEAILGFAAGLVLSAAAASAVASAVGYHGSESSLPLSVTTADVAALWLGLLAAIVYASRTKGTRSLRRDFGWRIGAWWDIPLGGAIGLACQFGLIPLLYLPFEQFDHGLSRELSRPAQRDTGDAHTVAAVIVLLVVLAIGAPLVEELFFRGLVLRSLLGRVPTPAAIVISAVLFGLAHFQTVQFGGLALFGVVLAVLAWRTGRLAPGIAAHAAFNAAAVISIVQLH